MGTTRLPHPASALPIGTRLCHLHPSRMERARGHLDDLRVPCYRSITIAARRENGESRVGGAISVDVLGPLRVTVQGEVVQPPAQVAPLVIALAVADRPVSKLDLARDVLYLSPRSIDSRLSRLHRAARARRCIGSPPPGQGSSRSTTAQSRSTPTDSDRSSRRPSRSRRRARRRSVGTPAASRRPLARRPILLGRLGDPYARTAFGRARDQLCQRLSGIRELAAQLSVGQRRDGPQRVRELRPPVGREREFADLWRHAEEVTARRGGLHLLSGEAGSGKSHLLAHLERSASSDLGIRVIHVDVEERVGFHRALRHGLAALWRELEHRADRPAELVEPRGGDRRIRRHADWRRTARRAGP